jgi:electron transfer flavoprotein beta subunit
MNVTSAWEAFDKPVEIINNQVLMLESKDIGLKGSPTQVRKTFTRPVSNEVKLIHGGSDEAVKAILSTLAPYLQ